MVFMKCKSCLFHRWKIIIIRHLLTRNYCILKTNIYWELEVYVVEEDDNNDDKEEKEEDDYPLKEPIMGYVWLLAVGEGQVCCERQGPSSLIDYPATNGPRAPQKESTVRSKPLNT